MNTALPVIRAWHLKVPTYAREFNQYNVAIDQKREEIIKLARNNPELYKDFSADLESLEVSYRNLRSNLSDAPNQEALLEAMVQNLQWQVDLLNQQLDILQRINKVKNDNDKENNSAPVI
jgi:CHASE3 domain sensor protein